MIQCASFSVQEFSQL